MLLKQLQKNNQNNTHQKYVMMQTTVRHGGHLDPALRCKLQSHHPAHQTFNRLSPKKNSWKHLLT